MMKGKKLWKSCILKTIRPQALSHKITEKKLRVKRGNECVQQCVCFCVSEWENERVSLNEKKKKERKKNPEMDAQAVTSAITHVGLFAHTAGYYTELI